MISVQKYKASFSMGVISSMEYRFDFFVNLLSTIFPIIIQVCLWAAIYSGSGNRVMYGYDFPQMIAYTTFAGALSKFVVTGIENLVNDDIHSGGLANFIVKPVKYVPFRMCQILGSKFTSCITMAIFTVVITVLLHITTGFIITLSNVILFVPAVFLAIILNFYLFLLISISAFWLTEVGYFFHTIQVVIMVLSGGVFPISVFGDTYVSIIKYFPVIYITYFPINVITGAIDTSGILIGMTIQVIWIMGLFFLTKFLWSLGTKRYVAVGG